MSVVDISEISGVNFAKNGWATQGRNESKPSKRSGSKSKNHLPKGKVKPTGRQSLTPSNQVPSLKSAQSHPRGSGPAAGVFSAVNSCGAESMVGKTPK